MGVEPAPQSLGSRLPREAWTVLLRNGTPRRFGVGDVLLRQGEPGTHVLVLTAGRVKVTHLEPDGTEVLLAVRGPGEVIGVIAVMDGSGRSATVTSLTQCITYILPAERFHRVITELGLNNLLLRHILARYREGEIIRAELAGLPAPQRVARVLLRYADSEVTPPSLVIGLSQDELALSVGLSRSAIATELARMRRQGLITTERRRIWLQDIRGLREIASSEDSHERRTPS